MLSKDKFVGEDLAVWFARAPVCNAVNYSFRIINEILCTIRGFTVDVILDHLNHGFQVMRNKPGILELLRQSTVEPCVADVSQGHLL